MSKLEQLAKMLEEDDSRVLAELSKAVSNLEKAIDQRFEAFDEVIQAIGDTVDSIEEKMDKDEKEPDDDKEELAAIKAEVKKAVEAVLRIRIPEQQKVDLGSLQNDVSMLKSGLALAVRKQDMLESSVSKLSQQLNKLITAKRVPEFDAKGNIIAVKLEA